MTRTDTVALAAAACDALPALASGVASRLRTPATSCASSGATSGMVRPSASPPLQPISFSAERFMMLMWPSASTPMTPALAPASTASVNSRRLSIRSRGSHNVVALGAQLVRHLVEGLAELTKYRLQTAATEPAPYRLPVETTSRCGDKPAYRRHQPVCKIEAYPDRGQQHRSTRSPCTSARR